MNDKDLDFLYFEDIVNQDILACEWIDVALSGRGLTPISENKEEKISIYPILIPNNENQKKAILEKDSWISGWEKIPDISEYNSIETLENESYYFENYGVKIVQFLCKSAYDSYTVRPDFIDEFGLVFDEKNRCYKNNKNEVIVKIFERRISVLTNFVKDYLFRKNLLLVRNFDCHRRLKVPSDISIGKYRDDKAIRTDEKSFYINLGEDKMYFDNKGFTDSIIIGKNIVFPSKMFCV